MHEGFVVGDVRVIRNHVGPCNGGEDVNEALQNISDETIEKVFAGKVALKFKVSYNDVVVKMAYVFFSDPLKLITWTDLPSLTMWPECLAFKSLMRSITKALNQKSCSLHLKISIKKSSR